MKLVYTPQVDYHSDYICRWNVYMKLFDVNSTVSSNRRHVQFIGQLQLQIYVITCTCFIG